MRCKSRRTEGYLLLEALIALSLLALGLLAFSESFASARYATKRSGQENRLIECASAKMLSEMTGLPMAAPECEAAFDWQHTVRPVAAGIEITKWTGRPLGARSDEGEAFETVTFR